MPVRTPYTFITAIVLTLAPAHKHTQQHTCTVTELGLDYCLGLNKSVLFIALLSEFQIHQYESHNFEI
jgi:hypothetical protein